MDLKSVLLHTEEYPTIHKAILDIASSYENIEMRRAEITQENSQQILDEIFSDGIINMGRMMCFIWIFKCLLEEVNTEVEEEKIISEAREYYNSTLKSSLALFG
jgi:hypothetical protein